MQRQSYLSRQNNKPLSRAGIGFILLSQLILPLAAYADAPSLDVTFRASPTSGSVPLNNVDLIADVSGTATGPITYKLDCTADGSWDKQVTTNDTSYTAQDLCSYSGAGNYLAKISIGRDGLFFEGTTAILVQGNTELSVTLSTDPSSSTTAPLNDVDLTADVSGSGSGAITYRFDCTNNGTWERTFSTSNTTYTAENLCDYENPGNYTAKVKVERSGLSFEGMASIAVAQGGGQTSGNLNVSKTARNVTSGQTSWQDSIDAKPGDRLEFRIEVSARNAIVNNIIVSDVVPAQLTYDQSSLQIGGQNASGDIRNGISIGNLAAGDSKTITFAATVNSAENFSFGVTPLTNVGLARSSTVSAQSDSATIRIQKAAVAGAATSVSTGVTEYLLIMMLITFMMALMIYFAWQRFERSPSPAARKTVRALHFWKSFILPR
ncbi:MAG: hypothetical protein A2667_00535 [Candidatus Wildermuthbacteria bacterium RIFCSPHIGHO2_01_FULL_47_27]|uniref:DUF11 domain-containing protein n=2 Tax=Candidatus Wildermuthiibacteriota TaxID=1817923 RepID=A0A1G2RMI1_9BACT|nr:MAG: Conserved repeat domain protein [Parcubacteria group bacterium GW2011_GWA2_47_9]OHA64215.1 MAG: hypothetical protein A2667_00535 [Candidatus Wildermuthbacteria bacterium RIFCSPHIGHO2_01_FULL_47_27]OHA67982.1 MAG: hypothetical protein A3D59_02490 [Candidatus Wildermuthbacteria bacterium RIFCSPHIGHO2_02_FULL_47_17]OHA73708.1 MAG: hypothetical protein A3A32_01050 [Candidatus Wildermuthbacteria bacterium RIFCSPLOWO2_01_FULL_48_35]OHA76459.1 MAG: hypothetical protein A3I38_00070 [Candidatus 